MDEWLLIITFLAEAITVLQCIQIVFRQTLKLDKYVVGIVIVDVVIYLLMNLGIIPVIGVIAVYILFGLLCYYKFKKNITQTVMRFIVSCALVGGIEGAATLIPHLFRNEDNSMLILTLSSIISLALTYLVKWLCHIFEKRLLSNRNARKQGIIIFYGLLLLGLFIDYHFNQSTINIYVIVALTFFIYIFFYMLSLEQAQNEVLKKNYELELQKIYGGTYESLLLEVRKRQHDYKNQLAAIYGMHLTAQTLEELVEAQRKYGDELKTNCRFDSILTCCNNSILAGFVYYRCVRCESENIAVDYNIHIEQAECRFELHEIIELLGILIDNACECVKMENSLEQRIKLELQEDVEKIVFSVSNPTNYISFSEIDRMFATGYSSKGENRGIGLARVSELVNKYEAEIKVFNSNPCNDKNWICFLVEARK